MARHPLARLDDIETTVSKLLAASRDRSVDDLAGDWVFNQACHYALQTIGEAANNLPAELRDRYPLVPWRKIIATGHRLRHEYFRIDPDVIWVVLVDHLPELQRTIRAIIADLREEVEH